MKDLDYLKRLFKAYYKEKPSEIPIITDFEHREFGFIPWDTKILMNRHMSFINKDSLVKFLINNGPRHVYSSGALYLKPENQEMKSKEYYGCDFIIDIDVDHFYTPCKDDHDIWYCKECGNNGRGMPEKCPKCGKSKFKTLNWICKACLNLAKNEIIKLIYDFLLPDFGISIKDIKITFSGHRGYHLKIENEKLRTLSSDERREIVDYITGENLSFENFGLQRIGENIFGFSRETLGWSQKILRKIEEILRKPNPEIEIILSNKKRFNFSGKKIENFLNFKEDFLITIKNSHRNNWTLFGFNLNDWNKFLVPIVKEIGIEIDTPVTIDIHRLIRYPGSLHGQTGFKVQELLPDEIEVFNPLDELNEKLDPIVFESDKFITQKLEIIESNIPATEMKGETHGPYSQGEIIEVPHHIAVFLLCKGVAKTI
ncbi:MAG: hypothetical protein JSV23_08415 [Promethearchaeota archaeon]|nr:MAG: hypothetical protein JSV23_08415 [Candidatus Lokiarchaeota archaeon]